MRRNTRELPNVVIYTDASMTPGSDIAGWGGVLIIAEHEPIFYSGIISAHTIAHAEMLAMCEMLRRLPLICFVTMRTDSDEALRAIWSGWFNKPKYGKQARGRRLRKELLSHTTTHDVQFQRARSRDGWVYKCHKLANEARLQREQRREVCRG